MWYEQAKQRVREQRLPPQQIEAFLRQQHGVRLADDVVSPSQETAPAASPAEALQTLLRQQHPQNNPLFSRNKADMGTGAWVLTDGSFTGEVNEHGESAAKVLAQLPQFAHIQDPLQAQQKLMSVSGAIRVRYVGNAYMIVDIAARPTREQAENLLKKMQAIESAGGGFQFIVLNEQGDTVFEGDSVERFLQVPWGRIFPKHFNIPKAFQN